MDEAENLLETYAQWVMSKKRCPERDQARAAVLAATASRQRRRTMDEAENLLETYAQWVMSKKRCPERDQARAAARARPRRRD
jgi:ribosome-binding protein aMBF1 (putative translation factor)